MQHMALKPDTNISFSTGENYSSRSNFPPIKTGCESRRLPSKIPVLQRTNLLHLKLENGSIHSKASLSAADKRQKFHQSRLHVAPPCSISKSFNIQCKTAVPWYNTDAANKILMSFSTAAIATQRNILPPIKAILPSSVSGQCVPQVKKKCLLGEITHFPALYNNIASKSVKRVHVSSVPHLPPILPEPAAPPLTISTSTEQKKSKVYKIYEQ